MWVGEQAASQPSAAPPALNSRHSSWQHLSSVEEEEEENLASEASTKKGVGRSADTDRARPKSPSAVFACCISQTCISDQGILVSSQSHWGSPVIGTRGMPARLLILFICIFIYLFIFFIRYFFLIFYADIRRSLANAG